MNVAVEEQVSKSHSGLPIECRPDFLQHSLILLGAVSILFAAVPELDMIVSRLFWTESTGFGLGKNGLLLLVRDTNRPLPWVVVGIMMVLMLAARFIHRMKHPPSPHKILYVITFFAVGPGLAVHLIKSVVGRARPRSVLEFGGNSVFTPPWELTDQCSHNCSFVSGEAASAFALLTLVVFIGPKRAPFYLAAMGVVVFVFSFNRVMFGAHFLSDVLLAWNVMWVLAILLWRWFSTNAPQIDAAFGRRR
jgi:lipid A 4'-phosphatase